ncbi:ribonuclease Z [Lacinutrix neustonica]|uniref:Ribonuclease Z n=1 Tax=Lacinutrix neustonica TaxID=2980107 RepID=A0A9E8MWL5_9FLAO|nr:ribonuclease Z [Lacinutrix neustonica]WAC02858.1 ribonuclease Z [Lacinutrix neustonica]
MILDQDGNISIITQEKATIIELVKKIEALYPKFQKHNIIVQLSSLEKVGLQDIIEFLRISNTHRAAKQSFVIVTNAINTSETPDEIIVVPTLKEAYDIIEMDEMERDLGF